MEGKTDFKKAMEQLDREILAAEKEVRFFYFEFCLEFLQDITRAPFISQF